MSSIPSIRVECAQCKQSFWVKLKKGTIPHVVVACPNCAYAWDLGKMDSTSIVHRSYKWDEFLMKMTALFQPKKVVEDVSEEIFREAGGSGDSMEESLADLPEIAFEPVSEISEVEVDQTDLLELGATSSETVREPDSESIPRPYSEERSLELTALRSVEELARGDSTTSVKPKETARYASIPSSPLVASDPEEVKQIEEVEEVEDVKEELDEEAMVASLLELEDQTIKEGELQTRPSDPQVSQGPPNTKKPLPALEKRPFGISKLALPEPQTPKLPGVGRESKTPASRPEKPTSDDEEHPALPKLERPLERKGAGELDVRSSSEEQSLELLRTEDFSTELARDQADDFFKSSAEIAAEEGGDAADFTDLGGATKVSATPLILAALLVFMIVVAGIVALIAS